jgi:hypothetical protein
MTFRTVDLATTVHAGFWMCDQSNEIIKPQRNWDRTLDNAGPEEADQGATLDATKPPPQDNDNDKGKPGDSDKDKLRQQMRQALQQPLSLS